MIDFTYLPTKKKAYGGANGSKLSVIYNNELYMLKLPMHALKNPNLSYTNVSGIIKTTFWLFLKYRYHYINVNGVKYYISYKLKNLLMRLISGMFI